MFATIRAAKGLGSSALYIRFRNSTGQYWDLVTLSWVASETANTRAYLTEYADSDTLESRYQTTVEPPTGGSYAVVEYVRLSDGRVLGEESDGFVPNSTQRLLGLGGANRVLDNEVMDGLRRVTSARIRVYDTAAHAAVSGSSGLLATYNVTASYGGYGETTMTVTEVIPS